MSMQGSCKRIPFLCVTLHPSSEKQVFRFGGEGEELGLEKLWLRRAGQGLRGGGSRLGSQGVQEGSVPGPRRAGH